ncbi:MAG TPA: c-type cytochrome [Candidatus Sulfotelmatobacter sp.]|jgi:putative heme-binding domain-containing protein
MRADLIWQRCIGLALIMLALTELGLAQANDNPALNSEGRIPFNTSCSECHGLDGRGTDKAIDIATSASIRNLTDSQIASIISEGVIEEGMPAFRSLNENQLRALVGYVRILQGKGEPEVLPGDPKRGQEIFFGKGDCGRCHSVAGRGGFMGPDLTNHAMTSSAEAIREEIIRSPRVPAVRYRMAALTTSAGVRFEGLVRNEDNFSIQLQTADGNFHLLRKNALKSFEYSNVPLMPTDYRTRLSDSELNDLASYLLTTPDKKNTAPLHKKWEEDEE